MVYFSVKVVPQAPSHGQSSTCGMRKVFLVETSGVKEKCHQSFSTFLGSCICSTTCKSVLAGALSNWSVHWQNILFNLTFKRFTEIEEFFIAGLPLWVPLRSGSCSPFFFLSLLLLSLYVYVEFIFPLRVRYQFYFDDSKAR